MNKRVKLKKAWTHAGEDFQLGEVLEVDQATCKSLVDQGLAVEVAMPVVKKTAIGTATKTKAAKGGSSDGEGEADGENDGDDTKAGGTSVVTMTDVQFKTLIKTFGDRYQPDDDDDDTKGAKRPNIKVIKERFTEDPALGYACPSDWIMDVYAAGTTHKGNEPTEKLYRGQKFLEEKAAKALGSDEYASVEDTIGGFFIQPQFDDRFLTKGVETDWVRENGAMIIPTTSTMLKLNAEVDRDRQTNLYGGVNVFWGGERQTLQDAKGKFRQVELKPDYLTGLYYITDHLLQSATALNAIIGRQFRDAFVRKETLAWLSGNGVGEPLGVLNSPALHSVTRNTTDSIKYADITGMRAHCFDYQNAVWVASKGAYETLASLNFEHVIQEAGANVGGSGQLVWQQQLVTDKPDVLLGRPLFFTEFLQTDIGTAGDLILVSWPHYLIAESPQFVNDSSIHVRFDSLETAFRFAKRLDGRPWWESALTLQNGFVVSPFVAMTTDT